MKTEQNVSISTLSNEELEDGLYWINSMQPELDEAYIALQNINKILESNFGKCRYTEMKFISNKIKEMQGISTNPSIKFIKNIEFKGDN